MASITNHSQDENEGVNDFLKSLGAYEEYPFCLVSPPEREQQLEAFHDHFMDNRDKFFDRNLKLHCVPFRDWGGPRKGQSQR
jgi:hypothetical protein